jgi:hypothetical protein
VADPQLRLGRREVLPKLFLAEMKAPRFALDQRYAPRCILHRERVLRQGHRTLAPTVGAPPLALAGLLSTPAAWGPLTPFVVAAYHRSPSSRWIY